MKLHLPTGLLTVAISAMSFAAATDYNFTSNQKLGDLTDADEINVWGSYVEVDSVNGGEGVVLYAYSKSDTYTPGGPAPEVTTDYPATLKVNSNLVLSYAMAEGLSSSNIVSIIAEDVKSTGKLTFSDVKVQALNGNVSVAGKRYEDDGFIARSSLTNTDLVADNGSVNIGAYLTMDGGNIYAAESVNITSATVNVNNLTAQNVNVTEGGVLNIGNGGAKSIGDIARVDVGEIAVGSGASLGINGAVLVLNEDSSITFAEGATLTAFNNVSFEFIVASDNTTGSYSFDVFAGTDNLTNGGLAIIESLEQAVAAGEIDITLKSMNAEGELVELDTDSSTVTFTDGTLSISTVPEPTTATLSLLALAALASRRRRN